MEHTQALFAALRSAERRARTRLIAGCADDAAKIDRFFERPLAAARRDARDALAANLRCDAFERISTTCAQKVRANAGLRARARFRMYTNELAQAEAPIADAIAATGRVAAKRLLPRMFSVGRIEIGEPRTPHPPERQSDIDGWIKELRACICDEISAGAKVARERVLSHGFDRLAIVKARVELALREPA